jgi:uncharacterized membrane protein
VAQRKSKIAITIIVLVIIVVATHITRTASYVRAFVVVPTVLLLPGYAVSRSLFVRSTITPLERVALSLTLSLAMGAGGGLVLSRTPWGLQPTSWAVWFGTITLVALAVARLRVTPGGEDWPVLALPRLSLFQGTLVWLALVVVMVAVGVARVPSPSDGIAGYTLLWIVPANRAPGESLRFGITSKELTTTAYRLELRLDGQLARAWSSIPLAPNQDWMETMALSSEAAPPETAELLLYRVTAPNEVYRHVMWRSDHEQD